MAAGDGVCGSSIGGPGAGPPLRPPAIEFLADDRGRYESVRGGAPAPELVAYARGFLFISRRRAQFIDRTAKPGLTVVLERTQRRGDRHDRVWVRAAPAVIPYDLTRREVGCSP